MKKEYIFEALEEVFIKVNEKDKKRKLPWDENNTESYDYGAHTGFINSRMLKSVGANYIILGHSENRKKGETDKLINLKVKSAIKAKLKIILCIDKLDIKLNINTENILIIYINFIFYF